MPGGGPKSTNPEVVSGPVKCGQRLLLKFATLPWLWYVLVAYESTVHVMYGLL